MNEGKQTKILQKAAKYKIIPPNLIGEAGEAHLRDPYSPPPQVLKPNSAKKDKNPDDITDFPIQKSIPIPESIPYQEGHYKPASQPFVAGYYPYNMYLEKGKVYNWCACGISQMNSPWCDGLCNYAPTRCRPVKFNVDEAGYYKICNCKQSANAPFCNGTHRLMARYYHSTHRGFYEIWGEIMFFAGMGYIFWNYYT